MKRRKIEEKKRKERELEDKGGNERTREKGRLGSPEGRRPVTRCRKRRDRTQFSPLPKIIKNPTKTWQKRQIHVKNQQKYHKNKAKTTI